MKIDKLANPRIQWPLKLVELPGHAVDATDGGVSKHVEGGGGEVEIPETGTTSASVGDSDLDLSAVVVGGQGPAADGVAVQDVSTMVAVLITVQRGLTGWGWRWHRGRYQRVEQIRQR